MPYELESEFDLELENKFEGGLACSRCHPS
jgi:hypothetical protein